MHEGYQNRQNININGCLVQRNAQTSCFNSQTGTASSYHACPLQAVNAST